MITFLRCPNTLSLTETTLQVYGMWIRTSPNLCLSNFLIVGDERRKLLFLPNGLISGMAKEDKDLEFILTAKIIVLLNLD